MLSVTNANRERTSIYYTTVNESLLTLTSKVEIAQKSVSYYPTKNLLKSSHTCCKQSRFRLLFLFLFLLLLIPTKRNIYKHRETSPDKHYCQLNITYCQPSSTIESQSQVVHDSESVTILMQYRVPTLSFSAQ